MASTGISFGEYMQAEEPHLFGKNQTTIFAFIFYTDEKTLIVNKDKSVKSNHRSLSFIYHFLSVIYVKLSNATIIV